MLNCHNNNDDVNKAPLTLVIMVGRDMFEVAAELYNKLCCLVINTRVIVFDNGTSYTLLP